jgi:hypothetical protein
MPRLGAIIFGYRYSGPGALILPLIPRRWAKDEIPMTVAELVAVLRSRAARYPDEEMIVHVTLPDGTIVIGDVMDVTEIGPGEGFALIATGDVE